MRKTTMQDELIAKMHKHSLDAGKAWEARLANILRRGRDAFVAAGYSPAEASLFVEDARDMLRRRLASEGRVVLGL